MAAVYTYENCQTTLPNLLEEGGIDLDEAMRHGDKTKRSDDSIAFHMNRLQLET